MRELQHTYFQPQSLLGTAIVSNFGSREMFEKSLTDTCMKGQPSPACMAPVPACCAAASASARCLQCSGLDGAGSRSADREFRSVGSRTRCRLCKAAASRCWVSMCGVRCRCARSPPPSCLTRHTEHAYYLKHANKRAPYIANMVQIINVRLQFSRAILPHAVQQSASLTHRVQWDVVDQLFVTALKQLPDTVMDQLLDSLHMPKEQL